jgi:hypothetical protein
MTIAGRERRYFRRLIDKSHPPPFAWGQDAGYTIHQCETEPLPGLSGRNGAIKVDWHPSRPIAPLFSKGIVLFALTLNHVNARLLPPFAMKHI